MSTRVRLFISSFGAERLQAARAFVSQLGTATEALLVGASRDAVDQLVWELPAPATFGLYRFSVTELAARLATTEFVRKGITPSTPLGAEAMAARVAFEALESSALGYLGPVARCPGFARALAATLAELRDRGTSPRQLAQLAYSGPDLAELLRRFEEQLTRASLADRTTLLRTATGVAEQADGNWWGALPMLLLDVPAHSAAERDFVMALARSSPSVLATVVAADRETVAAWQAVPHIEGAVAATPPPRAPRANRQRSRGASAPTQHALNFGDSALERLNRYLFSDTPPPRCKSDDGVAFFSAPGEARECVEITRRILEEEQAGVPFDQIAIFLRDPATYSDLVETALSRARIPAFFARGTRRPDPSGRAFLAVLACASEQLSAKRFAEYLSLAQVPDLDQAGTPPDRPQWSPPLDQALGPAATRLAGLEEPTGGDRIEPVTSDRPDTEASPALVGTLRAPWRWEELLVEAAVIGGKDRWARRLEGAALELASKREAVQKEEPDSPRALALERELRNLEHLRRFVLPIIETLASFPKQATWGAWLEALGKLAPRVLRHPERVLSVVAELAPMGVVGPVTLEEVRDALAERLSTLEQEPPRYPYGRVLVGTPEHARGRSFQVAFVPGLAERIFPQKLREDPLLLDSLRTQLASEASTLPELSTGQRDSARPGLDTQNDRLQQERLLLRLVAGSASKRVWFSYPRVEITKARQRVPSFYALDVRRAASGQLPDFQTLEREAAEQSASHLAWPAPTDPTTAIDNMEHDLAILGELLRRNSTDKTRGRARYLLELNEHLGRSLRTRYARWQQKNWSPFDGPCGLGKGATAALIPHRLSARPYSVSALQKFAVCPYQFLLSAIHRLEPREEPVPFEQLDPLTRGQIFHNVLAELMRTLRTSKALPVTATQLSTALDTLDRVMDEVANRWREDLAPAIDRVWQDAVESLRTDLRAWLQRLAEAPEREGWEPVRFEFGFGFPPEEGRDPESHPEPVTLTGGYKLHGWVDMIEKRASNTGQNELRVTDHKTGVNRTQDGMVVGGGEILQPVLYSLAVEAALGERVAEGRLFFCTSVGGFTERIVKMHDVARYRGIQVLTTIDQAVERAFLPPAPKEKACTWCDFRDVCGPEEEKRVREKDQEALEELFTLRGLP